MSQQAGAPYQGDTPGFAVDTSHGTTIARYEVVQVSENTTTSNNLMVAKCETDAAGRALAVGLAFTGWQYPPDPRIYQPSGQPSTDIGSGYDPGKHQMLAVRLEGSGWARVEIPISGSSITLAPGDRMVPSDVVPGTVMPRPAPTMTAATDVTTILAAYAADEAEQDAILGRAMSRIHVVPTGVSWGGRPSLQGSTPVNTLTASTTEIKVGYVFLKLGNG